MDSRPLPVEKADARVRWLVPSTRGTIYCGLSALAYGLMGICQRQVATSCDPVLVNCVQASVSTTIFGAYLLSRSLRGRSAWPPFRDMIALVGIGLVTQLGGVAYQWSIGMIGLAIANPLQMGVMLAGSAVLGFVLLGEKASWRCIAAVVLITSAVILLSLGAEEGNSAITAVGQAAEEPPAPTAQPNAVARETPKQAGRMLWPVLGVGAGVFCGLAFAVLTVGVRKAVTGDNFSGSDRLFH